MSSIEPYINTIIALLGLTYPILLQVIARLDEKYESQNIADLFKIEQEWMAFRYALVFSLIFVVIWSLKLEPLIQIERLNWFIENSATFLVSASTILLVVSFFFFVNKVLKYYTPYSLIPYLIKRHENSKSDVEYFPALSDLLLLSIKKQQTNLLRSLSDFFWIAFQKIRDKSTNKPVVYPDIYYETVHKAIEELAILKEKRNYMLEHRTSGGIWLIGELEEKELSEKTYKWLWRNLLIAIHYQQDDLIVDHWETCHQYYSFSLPSIYSEYGYDTSTDFFQVSNQEAVIKRDAERQRFIEFHYALGGLLTYKERYACIKRLFNHTHSEPPDYVLLPVSMNEIFKFYSDVRDPYKRKYSVISSQYSFPELGGLNADYEIKKWIMSYMAILFLRQYTITSYFTTMMPLGFPTVPSTQGEIKQWIDGIDFFKKLVTDHLQNKELLNTLNLDFITPQWCVENQKLYPITFIETFKSKLENDYNTNSQNLEISIEKVSQFENATKTIVESAIEKLQLINNNISIQDDNYDKWYVHGQRMIQDKDAFSQNSEVHYVNFDSILASIVSRSLNEGLGEIFFRKTSKSYLLKPEDFFKAIDKLAIDESFVIVNFGINLEYFATQLKVYELTNGKYKNTNIYSFSGSQIANESLFVLKKSDLPNISTRPIGSEIITKYTLKKISENINLYASVIDLNKAEKEVFDENKNNKSDDELRKSVLMSIILTTEFKWKKNIEVVQLRQYSEYFQRGIVNKLEDVN